MAKIRKSLLQTHRIVSHLKSKRKFLRFNSGSLRVHLQTMRKFHLSSMGLISIRINLLTQFTQLCMMCDAYLSRGRILSASQQCTALSTDQHSFMSSTGAKLNWKPCLVTQIRFTATLPQKILSDTNFSLRSANVS